MTQIELFEEPVEPKTPVYYRKENGELGQFIAPTFCANEAISMVKDFLEAEGTKHNAILAVVKGVPKCLATD